MKQKQQRFFSLQPTTITSAYWSLNKRERLAVAAINSNQQQRSEYLLLVREIQPLCLNTYSAS